MKHYLFRDHYWKALIKVTEDEKVYGYFSNDGKQWVELHKEWTTSILDDANIERLKGTKEIKEININQVNFYSAIGNWPEYMVRNP